MNDQRTQDGRSRRELHVRALEALATHLRRCVVCAESDVLKCPDGKLLWIAAAMPTDDLARFADGKLGCGHCGAYADSNGDVVHALPECLK